MSDASPTYEDDESILDDADLWRRIPPWHIVNDNNRGGKRISKAAFEDHPDGSPMSVVLGQEVLAAGRDPGFHCCQLRRLLSCFGDGGPCQIAKTGRCRQQNRSMRNPLTLKCSGRRRAASAGSSRGRRYGSSDRSKTHCRICWYSQLSVFTRLRTR